jgi:hypothetical protein
LGLGLNGVAWLMATNGVEGWPETAWSDQIVWAEPKQHEGIFFLMKIYATSLLKTFYPNLLICCY